MDMWVWPSQLTWGKVSHLSLIRKEQIEEPGTTTGLALSVWGNIGTNNKVRSDGWIIGPPADKAYAVVDSRKGYQPTLDYYEEGGEAWGESEA